LLKPLNESQFLSTVSSLLAEFSLETTISTNAS